MTEQSPRKKQPLLLVHRQSNFPNEDLSYTNAEFLGFTLNEGNTEDAYAHWIGDNLVPVFETAYRSLDMSEIPANYSEESYKVFKRGVAVAEQALLMVRMEQYNGDIGVSRTHELFVLPGKSGAERMLAERYAHWFDGFPNFTGVVMDRAIKNSDSAELAQARAIGAFIGLELQRDLLLS